MNNTEKIFLCITTFLLIALLIIIISGYIESCYSIKTGYWKLIIENSKKIGELEECRKYNLFQQAVSKIGKKPYTEEYDCYEHSKDLQEALREVDIESSIFINEDRSHAWVGVWIEANSGQFIGPENKYKIIEIR